MSSHCSKDWAAWVIEAIRSNLPLFPEFHAKRRSITQESAPLVTVVTEPTASLRGKMGKESKQSEQPVQAAGFAGVLKKVVLALACLGMVAVGTFTGIYLERSRASEAPAEQAADQHSAEAPPTANTAERAIGDAGEVSTSSLADADPFSRDLPESAAFAAVEENPAATDSSAQTSSRDLPPSASTAVSSTGSPKSPGTDSIPEKLPSRASGDPQKLLKDADEFVLEGNCPAALEKYSELVHEFSGWREADIRLRMGLCREAQGDLRGAQSEYRRVVELRPGLELQDAAVLGQARLWSRAERPDVAISILFRALLEGGLQGARALGSQLPHQLAILISARVGRGGTESRTGPKALADSYLITPELTVRADVQLQEFLANERPSVAPIRPTSVEEVRLVQRFSSSPNEIFLNVRTGRIPALELIRRVSNLSGWQVRLTEEARLRLQERTLTPDCIDLPLALILDAVLEPSGVIWRTEDDAILACMARESTSSEIEKYRHAVAERALRFAIATSPEHPWAAVAYLEMGRLDLAASRLDRSVANVRSAIDLFPHSPFHGVALLNLGKLELRRGQLEEAGKAFLNSSDLLGGHPLEPLGYLYAGRINLERDNPREAILPLTRSLVLSEGTEVEATAAMLLASGYFLLNHLQRANEVLVEHQSGFQLAGEQDRAAFLAALIRYHATRDERQKLREGSTLITALTNLRSREAFGGHWPLLTALAYRDTGMTTEETDVLKQALQLPYPFPLQNRMRLMLLEDAGVAEAQAAWMSSPAAGETPTIIQIQAMLADVSLAYRRGEFDRAMLISRNLLQSEDVPEDARRVALRTMGRVYQSRGLHELAVQCFAGIIPEESGTSSTQAQQPVGGRQ